MAAVASGEAFRRLSLTVLRILGVAVAYYAGGQLGLLKQVRIEGATVTPLWPATGIALTALLLLGLDVWPGITLGTLFSIVTLGPFVPADVAILAGNTLAPVCACLMLRRVGFRPELDRLRDGVALVFLGALVGMLISATAGAGAMVLAGRLAPGDFWAIWSAWWAGDAMGVLVVAPFLLALRRFRLPVPTHRWPEVTALVITAAVLTPLAIMSSLTLLFLVFPVLIWAALRFELPGSAPYVLFVSVLTISESTDPVGGFAHHNLIERMIGLQALNGSAALTSLLLAAIITEQRNVRLRIEQACDALGEVVERLVPGEKAGRWRQEGGRWRRDVGAGEEGEEGEGDHQGGKGGKGGKEERGEGIRGSGKPGESRGSP
ncbi:MASE1 domain-containing protein [Streptomyces sp. NBC_00872]|uniref:MASE1 domain-containing protein n=1 Tax=Streptomyces sp. NBC_00872 TaxID=2903686 RepID=UPI003866AA32|nr:MASE1 domain-containing protein [Streptomyces sp. NBC_00872]